jgi:hypothetical protein
MERLKALESGEAAGRLATLSRSPDFIRWFSAGFAGAWVCGGIALFALMSAQRADATPSVIAPCFGAPVLVHSDVTPSSVMEARVLWWKLSLSIERNERLAHAD